LLIIEQTGQFKFELIGVLTPYKLFFSVSSFAHLLLLTHLLLFAHLFLLQLLFQHLATNADVCSCGLRSAIAKQLDWH